MRFSADTILYYDRLKREQTMWKSNEDDLYAWNHLKRRIIWKLVWQYSLFLCRYASDLLARIRNKHANALVANVCEGRIMNLDSWKKPYLDAAKHRFSVNLVDQKPASMHGKDLMNGHYQSILGAYGLIITSSAVCSSKGVLVSCCKQHHLL